MPDWPRAVQKLSAGALVKAVGEQHILVEAKQNNPEIYTCLRYWNDALQHYDGGWFEWAVAIDRARTWFRQFVDGTFRDQIAPFCDSVQFHNEVYANSQTTVERIERLKANQAAAWVWNTEYRTTFSNDIRLVLSSAAIGNDHDKTTAELAIAEDCLMAYHPYFYWTMVDGQPLRAANDWDDLSGRWEQNELAWGLKPDWIFPESGPFESAVTGWRSPECLNHNQEWYVDAVRDFILDCQDTAAYQEGRLYGFALFTTGRTSDTWKGFWTEQPEMDALAEMIAMEWHPGTAPPKPDPDPDLPYTVVVNLLPQDATIDEKIYVVEEVHEAKETILQSADDAARLTEPGKDGSLVKVWGVDRWEDDILTWLLDHGAPAAYTYEFSDEAPAFEIVDIVNDLSSYADATYQFEDRPLEAITALTIHHTVSGTDRDDITAINGYHQSTNDWERIGYHFCITKSGEVYQTNHLTTESFHAGSIYAPGDENYWSVGIALLGNFTRLHPPQIQQDAARWLVAYLKEYLAENPIDDVLGHRDMPGGRTQCPGNSYQEWIDYIIG